MSIHLAETSHFETKQFSNNPQVSTDLPQPSPAADKKKKSLPVRKLLEMERGAEGSYFTPLQSDAEEEKQQQVTIFQTHRYLLKGSSGRVDINVFLLLLYHIVIK